ncbi:MAG TPA: hypothetical protein PKD76_04700 [Solirubrobacterales bacterium]|nr:hypothetical protein [Solirubrobacterales bacterium]
MSIIRGGVEGVVAILPGNVARTACRPILVQAEDGHDYWCKVVENPMSDRVPTNELIAAGIGEKLGVAMPKTRIMDVTELIGWEFVEGRFIRNRWAFGSRNVIGGTPTHDLKHEQRDGNSKRYVGFYALYDLLVGGDPQWLINVTDDHGYLSFDHGHFFPGGPDWSTRSLRPALQTEAHRLNQPPGNLDLDEVNRVGTAIESLSRADIDEVVSRVPPEWPVSDPELAALAGFIDARRETVTARLRERLGLDN